MMIQPMQSVSGMVTSINKRPFFSIVIPCYNSRNVIKPLLDSIVQQKMDFFDIQVIISDDCSTESYQDIIDKYLNLLYITQVKTDYNCCCPGNTRQKGVDNAIGQWLCFADHDDMFIPESLSSVKQAILENGCKTVFSTKFLKKGLNSEQLIEMPQFAGWTHGKFYNLDNLWNKYNIHYIKDMASHEDIYVSTQMQYFRIAYNLDYYTSNIYTYIWYQYPESLSSQRYNYKGKERLFLDTFFIDYIQATSGVFYKMYKKYGKAKEEVFQCLVEVILYSYFYTQYNRYITPEYLSENYDQIRKYLQILKNQFNYFIMDIYNYYRNQYPDKYKKVAQMAVPQTAWFVYDMTFKEWLEWIWYKRY